MHSRWAQLVDCGWSNRFPSYPFPPDFPAKLLVLVRSKCSVPGSGTDKADAGSPWPPARSFWLLTTPGRTYADSSAIRSQRACERRAMDADSPFIWNLSISKFTVDAKKKNILAHSKRSPGETERVIDRPRCKVAGSGWFYQPSFSYPSYSHLQNSLNSFIFLILSIASSFDSINNRSHL